MNPMSWIAGRHRKKQGPRETSLPAHVEVLETRSLLATVTVQVVNFAFNPSTVTIQLGDSVHWVWNADNHSTTSVAGIAESWNSGIQNTGFTFDHTFTRAGSFAYYCIPHGTDNGNGTASGMAGTIEVVGSATPVSIAVMPENPVISPGATERFMATGSFPDGTTQNLTSQVTWASANAAVATISNASGSEGVATGLAAGTTTISATLNGIVGSTVLNVTGTPAPPIPPSIGRFRSSGLKIQAKVNKTYHGYVSYFSEPNTTPRDFRAAIDWGDNSKRNPGHVHGRGYGHYAIIGQHRYIRPGVFNVTVTIKDTAGRKIAAHSLIRIIR
jgi:plastocyanin